MYIIKQEKGLNQEYGLSEELRITDLSINGKDKVIVVKWELVIASPTDKIVKVLNYGEYTRYDSANNLKFTQLENSPIGQGIKQMLEIDLALYPNFEQN
jgi:hypothetical protein